MAADYFPLEVGNSWTYSPSYGDQGDRVDSITVKEEVNSTPTYIWNRQEAPDDNYNEKRWLAKDDAYLKIYKISSNEEIDPPVIFAPPWIMFKLNPVVGDTWIFEGDLGSIYVKSTHYVESITESITVTAGTFSNCIRVRELNEITVSNSTEYEYEKKWYAPDVGLIIDRKYTENWAVADFSQELVSFSISKTQKTMPGIPLLLLDTETFALRSSSFSNGAPIPMQYSLQGGNLSPPLSWSNAPANTNSFVLIMDDPDAPGGTWDHWIIYNIPAGTTSLAENAGAFGDGDLPSGAEHGINSWGNKYYQGPSPPFGTHRYYFKLYALSVSQLNPSGTNKAAIEAAMAGKIMGQTELMGTYTYNP